MFSSHDVSGIELCIGPLVLQLLSISAAEHLTFSFEIIEINVLSMAAAIVTVAAMVLLPLPLRLLSYP